MRDMGVPYNFALNCIVLYGFDDRSASGVYIGQLVMLMQLHDVPHMSEQRCMQSVLMISSPSITGHHLV